jgi:hypothetical protein
MGCQSNGGIGASWATWALPVSLCNLLGLPGASWAILGFNLIVFVRMSAVLAMLQQKNIRNVRETIGSPHILYCFGMLKNNGVNGLPFQWWN